MTIARTIYMTSAIALASVLAVTIFSTGCGEDDTQSNDSTRSSSATINTQKTIRTMRRVKKHLQN